MKKLKIIRDNIEEVRELLNTTIQIKVTLTDPEILYISQQLDCLLNEYNRLNMSE